MIQIFLRTGVSLLLGIFLLMPSVAFAQDPAFYPNYDPNSAQYSGSGSGGSQYSGSGSGGSEYSVSGGGSKKLDNPLKFGKVEDFIAALINALLIILMPVMVLALIYAGLLYVFAQGNEKKIKDAHAVFFYTVIGAALILGAWTLAKIIQATVGSITRGGI